MEDLREASEILIKALLIREKYMSASMQWFSQTAARFLRSVGENAAFSPACSAHAAGVHCDPKMTQGKCYVKCCIVYLEVAQDLYIYIGRN